MRQYKIITDGSCDLDDKYVSEKNLTVIPFYINFGADTFKEKEKMSVPQFYEKMINTDLFPKTSCPSVDDYYKEFKKCAQNNCDIICLCITKKFSGSYNSAQTAKKLLLEEYSDIEVTIIDTMVNTVLQGLIVRQAIMMQEANYSYDDVIASVEGVKNSGRIFFTVNGLSYLKHGGRIGKVASIIGNALKINPIIVLEDGEIHASSIAVSRNRAVAKVRDIANKYIKESGLDKTDFMYCVGYGHDLKEAQEFKMKLSAILNVEEKDIILNQIGSTIAVHTGPYPLGIGIIKKIM